MSEDRGDALVKRRHDEVQALERAKFGGEYVPVLKAEADPELRTGWAKWRLANAVVHNIKVLKRDVTVGNGNRALKRQGMVRCRHCEKIGPDDKEDIIDGLCEDCSTHYEYCNVCRTDISTDSLCRHLFWAEWGEYLGSGASSDSWKDCRESFLLLMEAVETEPRIAIYRACCNESLLARVWGSILSNDGLDVYTVFNKHNEPCHNVGRSFSFLFERGELGEYELGGQWLLSLEGHAHSERAAKATSNAFVRTARWMSERWPELLVGRKELEAAGQTALPMEVVW